MVVRGQHHLPWQTHSNDDNHGSHRAAFESRPDLQGKLFKCTFIGEYYLSRNEGRGGRRGEKGRGRGLDGREGTEGDC